MDADRFDTLITTFARMWSRRSVVRGAAAIVGGLGSGAATRGGSRAADEVPPPPPASFTLKWPVCSAERPHYCVDAFTVDGQAGGAPAYIADVTGLSDPDASGLATHVLWLVNRSNDDPLCDTHTLAGCGWNLEDADLGKEMFLRIRTGRLKPYYTQQVSGIARIQVTGSETTGWEVKSWGRPGILAWPDNPPADQEQAAYAYTVYHAEGYTREDWEPDHQPFEGLVAATTFDRGEPEWVDGAWQVRLRSPHFLPDGSVNHGSYAAWLAPANLQRMGLTTEQAVAGALTITRTDEGVVSPVDVSISEFNSGIFIEIPDLTFSSPTIIMRKRQGASDPGPGDGASPHACPKRKVYKHGRCVKKRKHKKKGKGKKHRQSGQIG